MTGEPSSQGAVFESVWDALEDSPAQATNMRLKSELLIAILGATASWITDEEALALRLELTRPRLTDLLRGRIERFSIDALTEVAFRAGLSVQVRIAQIAA